MISFLFGRKKSANSAKERLQLVLIHDRTDLSPAQLELLKDDLIVTISRHIDIDPTSVRINMAQDGRGKQRLVADIPLKTPPAGGRERGAQQAFSIMFRSNFWRHFDYWLLGAVIIALVFGVTICFVLVAAGNENLTGLTVRQIIFGGIGFVIIVLAAAYRLPLLVRGDRADVCSDRGFGLAFIVGGTRFGATRRIETGLVSIQPTELAKMVVILALANFFDRNIELKQNWGWLLKSLIIALGIAGLIFIQPNLSNVILIMVLWAAMAWVAGLQLKQVGILALVVVVVGAIAFSFLLQPYQRARITTFIFPPANASYGATYNVLQALAALVLAAGWARAMDTARRRNCAL